MGWSLYADQQCIGYDAGRPFWPCETPRYSLTALNAPAIALGHIPLNVWPSAPEYLDFAIDLPFILLWWWFVGTRIDFGLLGVGIYKRRRLWVTAQIIVVTVLVSLLAWSIWQEIAWHRKFQYLTGFGYLRILGDLRSLPLYLWLIALIIAFAIAAFRISRGQVGRTAGSLTSRRSRKNAGFALVVYIFCATAMFTHIRNVERQKQEQYDLSSVIINGKIVDDHGAPVTGISVELVPLFKSGDAQWSQTVHDWTNKNGEYTLRPEEMGNYFLAVLWNAAPDAKLPFLTRYYPDNADEEHSETLSITPALHRTLATIKLQRLEVVTVPVFVTWSNGKPEPNAYLFFRNKLFLKQGAIGNETSHPDANGKVSLPANFDYLVNAQVECDGGREIVHPYSPEVPLSTRQNGLPTTPIHLVLPGQPCTIWAFK
jgi:hypothetical protein